MSNDSWKRKKQMPRAASAPRKNRGKKKARGTPLGMTALKQGERRKEKKCRAEDTGSTLKPKTNILDWSFLARIGNAKIVRAAIIFDSCETT
jgi:hypothetical protein